MSLVAAAKAKLAPAGHRTRRRSLSAVAALAAVALAGWALWRAVTGAAGSQAVEAFPGLVGSPDGMVRLHVIAHSDAPADQAAKLAVRDALLPVVSELYRQAPPQARRSGAAWLAYLQRHRARLEEAARAALDGKHGPRRSVRVEAGPAAFPAASYQGIDYPAGRYLALRVIIGDGKGHNWWCVAFPFLCPASRPEPSRAQAAPPSRTSPTGAEAAGPTRPGDGAAAEGLQRDRHDRLPLRPDPAGAPGQSPLPSPGRGEEPGWWQRLWPGNWF